MVNGANGPFLTSSGFYSLAGGAPFVEIDDCGSTTRAGGVLDTSIAIFDNAAFAMPYIGYNDDCGTGTFGGGSDPNASCFGLPNMFNSCTCVAGTAPLYIEADAFGNPPEPGSTTFINVNKKVACAGALAGSCCISNGRAGTVGCTDDLPASACTPRSL